MNHPQMNHPQIVSHIVVRCILEANAGCWPTEMSEWQQVAWRFGASIVFRDPAILPGPFLRNNVIYIPACGDARSLELWLTHEIAEAALLWEGEPPYILPGPHDGLEAHRIARLTEQNSHIQHSCPRIAQNDKAPHRYE